MEIRSQNQNRQGKQSERDKETQCFKVKLNYNRIFQASTSVVLSGQVEKNQQAIFFIYFKNFIRK